MKCRKFLPLSLLASSAMAAAPQATLTWNPVTLNADGSALTGAVTYNVYQGVQGGTLSKVQSGLTAASASVTMGLTAGSTQCFAVSAVVQGVESAQSAQACAAIPFPVPGAPTQVVVVVTG